MPNYSENRPWGSFENLIDEPFCKVKKLVVLPGGRLSLQSHKNRDEHWVVVHGIATVTSLPRYEHAIVRYGSHVYIPRNTKHRLENFGKDVLILVEIQVGDSFEESDIIRYEDIYNRN